MIYAGRSSYVEEMFLQAGSIICGPRSIGPVSRKELLALPTNNGVAHQEARMLRCSSSLVNQFPRTIRRCQLKPVVRQFMNSQEDTTRDFVPPELDRERQEPSQGEAQLHSNVYHNAFKIVNRVLKKEYHDQRLRFEWRLPPNAAVPGRNSLGGAPSGKKPDVNLMIPNTNHKKGAAEAKCLWILHEGRTSRDMEAANLDRLDRPLLIKPEEDPKVDLVDVFNQGDDSHPITKSLGQIHGYSRRGNYSIALLTCDAFTWALVTDPENLEDPFLSEHFRSTDVGPSTHETRST
ncbi:hypothetical protein KFL_001200125 [Klebsormidium nitens]|uniref:Uncharacterized protein n=1 Tax=Klebsormidium nitens TaxID=105231 RepID=A0A1Y1I3K4_KLENI|nr:hypothetical protein KFL_001200125 [Klebsormidium nitens]|eukprot:GAQ82688.1 hypothetical protein KFL_001200125 [Klebsormidium nitens]